MNYGKITWSLRQLRRRRSLLRLRRRHRNKALARMCEGRGGNGLGTYPERLLGAPLQANSRAGVGRVWKLLPKALLTAGAILS